MIQLNTHSYSDLLPLYKKAPKDFPLIRSVIEQSQPGFIHVDRKDNPRIVFVSNRYGFSYYFGNIQNAKATDCIFATLKREPVLRDRYLLWYDPPLLCQKLMDSLGEKIARKRIRVRFFLPEEFYKTFVSYKLETPDNVHVVGMDSRVLDESDTLGLDIGGRFWPTKAAFLSDGIGVAVRYHDEIVSICYAASIAGGIAEIDVATHDRFRSRGFAQLASKAFISLCLRQNLKPSWDCFDYNASSFRLAHSLGFRELVRYPFYSLNT